MPIESNYDIGLGPMFAWQWLTINDFAIGLPKLKIDQIAGLIFWVFWILHTIPFK